MVQVYGDTVDDQTRCIHYNSVLDVIALKFKCCQRYYPCHQCHRGHPVVKYAKSELDAGEKVIFCGVCKNELTFADYTSAGHCPNCGAQFNPGCKSHMELYFDMNECSFSERE